MQDRSPPTRRNLLATHGRTIHLGQKQTLAHVRVMSALPPKAHRLSRSACPLCAIADILEPRPNDTWHARVVIFTRFIAGRMRNVTSSLHSVDERFLDCSLHWSGFGATSPSHGCQTRRDNAGTA